jgi:hypothetical protein
VDGVSGRAELVRERKKSGRLPLRMVKEQDLGHFDARLHRRPPVQLGSPAF